MPALRSALAELLSAASACLSETQEVGGLPDDELLGSLRTLAEAERVLETAAAALSAEIQHRSRRELGYDGLAQRHGARTPEALVQVVTGSTASTARRLVRVGTLVAHDESPWLAEVLAAFSAAELSADAVDAIRAGLGEPSPSLTSDALATAARHLLALAPIMPVERLAALARDLRDELDVAGVAFREQERRDRRFLRLYPQPDGMTRLVGLLDPESAAVVTVALDAVTSPRRGGPRFVEADDVARAERIINDERTTEQLALDSFVELIDVATRADTAHLLGARRPEVRVIVTQRELDRGTGAAQLEGQVAAVSVTTAERLGCDGGQRPMLFDSAGAPLDLGRRRRRHSARQRILIAARDGGCLFPECDRPPNWCEVHHIVPWSEGGQTDLADGVLLCRHHHMLMHNNAWRIRRRSGEYWLYPPPEISTDPVLLRSKSPTVRRLAA